MLVHHKIAGHARTAITYPKGRGYAKELEPTRQVAQSWRPGSSILFQIAWMVRGLWSNPVLSDTNTAFSGAI
jgi:hypothetical protein